MKARDRQLIFADRPAAAVRACERRCAVRSPACYLFHIHESRLGVGRANHDHSEVKQGQMKARDRGFVASMLGADAGEHTADLVDQIAAHPMPTALIEKIAHLGAHVAEARGCAEDDRVRIGKLLHPRHRNVAECRARLL